MLTWDLLKNKQTHRYELFTSVSKESIKFVTSLLKKDLSDGVSIEIDAMYIAIEVGYPDDILGFIRKHKLNIDGKDAILGMNNDLKELKRLIKNVKENE